jgi:hypothetical protein
MTARRTEGACVIAEMSFSLFLVDVEERKGKKIGKVAFSLPTLIQSSSVAITSSSSAKLTHSNATREVTFPFLPLLCLPLFTSSRSAPPVPLPSSLADL